MATKKPNSLFFDTNVYVNLFRSPEYERKIESFFQGACLYTVNKIVLMELWAGVRTKTEENILKEHQSSFPLCGFLDDGFIVAGQVMKKMSEEQGFEPKVRRRISWDILIAISASQNNSCLITENEKDFRRIQKYVDFELLTVS